MHILRQRNRDETAPKGAIPALNARREFHLTTYAE
jgi:hypothetical protein